jgi:hypothetical protein
VYDTVFAASASVGVASWCQGRSGGPATGSGVPGHCEQGWNNAFREGSVMSVSVIPSLTGGYSILSIPTPRPTPLWFSFRSALSPLSLGESNRQSAQWRQACPTTRKRACASGQQALGFRRISRSSSPALSPGPVSSPRRASASAGALVVVAFTSFGTRRTMT